jgi:hypothetical protein
MRLEVERDVGAGVVVYRYAVRDVVLAEVRSPRPYHAGMIVGDGTTGVAALALFVLWCRSLCRSPSAIAASRGFRGRFGRRECERLLTYAMAEGLSVPDAWDRRAEEGLAESLADAGEAELASAVATMLGCRLSPEGLIL